MAQEPFKLPISSYEELVKVIKAYGTSTEELSLDDVSRVSAIHNTVISGNNRFLIGIGVLEGGQRKRLSDVGRRLSRALEFEVDGDMRSAWQEIVEQSDFMRNVLAAVRIRKGMDIGSLRAHVAYSAGLPKRPSAMTGAGTVVEILRTAGFLAELDGKFVAAQPLETPVPSGARPPLSSDASSQFVEEPQRVLAGAVQLGGVPVVINVQIQCSAAELEDLGPRIRRLLLDLAEHGDED